YEEGARDGGHDVRRVALRELEFSLNLPYGYRRLPRLEPALKKQQRNLVWCERLVVVTPVWWFGAPALLKGFLERVLLPDFAFRFREGWYLWDKLLAGRAARIVYTQGAPQMYVKVMRRDCFWQSLGEGTLAFCGFRPVERTIFSSVPDADEPTRRKWLSKVRE